MSQIDLIDALGEDGFEAELDRYLESLLPLESVGIFYWQDFLLPKPDYDRFDKVQSRTLYRNIRKIFPVNPIAYHKVCFDRPTVFSYNDIAPTPSHAVRDAMERGVPIREAGQEAMGYRPEGWPEALDDLKYYLPLQDGRKFVISMKRLGKFGGFSDADRAVIEGESAFLAAVISKHVALKTPVSRADGQAVSIAEPANEEREAVRISNKEKEALRWAIAGKTMDEIAMITGMSSRTIRYYLYSVRDRYGYATVQQTLVRVAKDYHLDP